MAGKWNARNRRMAKLRARDNWFKGSQEVEPPRMQEDGSQEESARVLDNIQESVEAPDNPDQDQPLEGREDAGSSQSDKETTRSRDGEDSRRMENKKVTKLARKGKRRGPDRQSVTLGGIRKQEKSQRRRTLRHMNKELGKSGIPACKKSKADKRMMEPPLSV
jgi:hypothetical protein